MAIRKHEFHIGQRVWFYTTGACIDVVSNVVQDFFWDDDECAYFYKMEDERDLVHEESIRSTEYEAHELLQCWLEVSIDASSTEIERYKKLLYAENKWIDSHDVKFHKDTRSKQNKEG